MAGRLIRSAHACAATGTGQTRGVRALASAASGFLLAVLWFDLMFDVQVQGHSGTELPSSVLDSIGTYYARVTTSARPMNRLVALAMLVAIGALVAEVVRCDLARWRSITSLVLTLGAVGLAGARTVGDAVRLGTGAGDPTTRSVLARRIRRDHLCCIAAIATSLLVQLLPLPS